MDKQPPRRVEDYTEACLWMGLVNLFWILGAIWAVFGMIQVLVVAFVLNRLISRLALYKAARD